MTGQQRRPATAVAAAMAVLGAASAFTGVLTDSRWLLPAVVTVAAVAGIGVLSRNARIPLTLTVGAQLLGLLAVLTFLFTTSAFLGLIPGPGAVGELWSQLLAAGNLVRTGVPPVPADTPLQALICLGLGVVAIAVDLTAVGLGAPAVTGLMLLCVYAVPTSLANDMLPWWTFAAAALSFALLLITGGGRDRGRRGTLFGWTTAVLTATAAVSALLAGVAFSGVGTEGRLPGSVPEEFSGTDQIGLQPFTSLRGQLNRDRVVEMFRVRGLKEDTYLRAMTLRKFDPQQGWQLEGLTQGVDAGGKLPLPEGTDIPDGVAQRVEVQPIGYRDAWLPVFGTPESVTGMGTNWHYDPAAGIVFTQTPQESRPYTEQLVVPRPTPEQLRAARGPIPVSPAYLSADGVSPQVTQLAQQLTANERTAFDKTVAINRFFTDPANGFRYDLRTAPGDGQDALADFLFHGKRGFCAQYASAMAVLLRAAGIPSRVAVGFTAGYADGDERVITTADAHAWVEAYFPHWGWQTFDPTPLSDGRTALPQFLDSSLHPAAPPVPTQGQQVPSTPPTVGPAPEAGRQDTAGVGTDVGAAPEESGGWLWPAGVLLGIACLAALAVPAAVRMARRRRRLIAITEGAAGAADLAWREVLDEFLDRGTQPGPADTARRAASKLIDGYALDGPGTQAMRSLVTAVEHEWYAPAGDGPPGNLPDVVGEITASLHRVSPLSWRARLFPRSVLQPG